MICGKRDFVSRILPNLDLDQPGLHWFAVGLEECQAPNTIVLSPKLIWQKSSLYHNIFENKSSTIVPSDKYIFISFSPTKKDAYSFSINPSSLSDSQRRMCQDVF